VRAKRYIISQAFLRVMLSGITNHWRVIQGMLPVDAVLIDVRFHDANRVGSPVCLVYTSDSFSEVVEGDVIPTETVTVESIEDGN